MRHALSILELHTRVLHMLRLHVADHHNIVLSNMSIDGSMQHPCTHEALELPASPAASLAESLKAAYEAFCVAISLDDP